MPTERVDEPFDNIRWPWTSPMIRDRKLCLFSLEKTKSSTVEDCILYQPLAQAMHPFLPRLFAAIKQVLNEHFYSKDNSQSKRIIDVKRMEFRQVQQEKEEPLNKFYAKKCTCRKFSSTQTITRTSDPSWCVERTQGLR